MCSIFDSTTLVERTHHYPKIAYLSCWFPAALAMWETIFGLGAHSIFFLPLLPVRLINQEVAA